MALRIVVLVSVAVCAWCAAEAGKPSAEGDPRADIQVGYHAPPRHLEQPVSVLASGSGAHDLAVSVNATAGTYDVSFRGSTWLRGGEREIFCTRAAVALRQVAGAAKISGSDTWGAYSGVRMQWAPAGASDGSVVLQTSVRVYEGSPIAVFGQTWPQGAPAIPATRQCSAGAQYAGRDQTGGEEFANLGGGYTDETCCDACSNNTTCDVWVRQPSTGNCWLVKQPHGTKAADGRNIGFKQPLKSASDAVAAFPTFSTTGANETLNSITWGGCQVAPTVQTRWSDNPNPPGGETDGIPLSLYTESMDAMLLGPTDNFFVALHEQRDSAIGAGIKDSVGVIPPNFVHETILVGGQGFNDTLIAFGDALLAKSGKPRVDPYADTVLSNLGYWTDNGAYYYHSTSGFDNHEDAIKAKIKEGKNLSIPYNYVQWCECSVCLVRQPLPRCDHGWCRVSVSPRLTVHCFAFQG